MDEKVDKMASYEKEIDEKMEVVRKMLNSARSTLKQAGVDSHSRSPTSRTTKIITRREFATQVSQVTMPAKGSPERSITTIKNHKHSPVRNSGIVRNETMKTSPSRRLTTVNDKKPDFERKSNSIIVESG